MKGGATRRHDESWQGQNTEWQRSLAPPGSGIDQRSKPNRPPLAVRCLQVGPGERMLEAIPAQREDKPMQPASSPTVVDPRRSALYTVLAQVPPGQVLSYGQLAALAGLGRAARWVGRCLSQLPEASTLPWHRVVAAGGRLSLPAGSPAGDEQRRRLNSEGVQVRNGRVDIRRHGWHLPYQSG